MDGGEFWLWLVPVFLLPVFFAMGWFAARVDMRAVLKQAKSIPVGFYKSLDALVEQNNAAAARALAEVIDQQSNAHQNTYELHLTMGKLYRRRGENDKAIALHQSLLNSPDITGHRREIVTFELGQDFQKAGLVDRAEQIFLSLEHSSMSREAHEILLSIYQQDRDWEKAIQIAKAISHGHQSYQFEIAQFYCEIAQVALYQSNFELSASLAEQALKVNRKCTRANMILGDGQLKQNCFQKAIDAFSDIEKQNHEYLSMIGDGLYDAYAALGKSKEGLAVLVGFMKTFPKVNLLDIIYEKTLLLYGEQEATEIILELVRRQPDLAGVYRLLGVSIPNLNPQWRDDVDMIRTVISRQMQKSLMYRCRHCHFKSQVFFWHCPACNKWETFTPNRIEV